MNVWAHIADCLERGGACALVTVALAEGSSPRDSGARMIVTGNAEFHGTIGGGTLEFEAIRRAAAAVQTGVPAFSLQTVSLGPDLGQCCGGRVQLAIEVLTAEALDQARHLASLEAQQGSFQTEARVTEQGLGQRRVSRRSCPGLFAIEADETSGSRSIIEQFGTRRRALFLFGAGHVGKALVLALAPLPFEIFWIDSRREQFPGPVPANVHKIASASPASELDQAPDGSFVLAMTHSHALDEEIMARALLQQRFAYCGVIGSATKRARFQKRLNARGLNDALVARMVCPVGVTAVNSKQPAAIAAGIAVDLLVRDEACHQQAASGEGLAQKRTHGR
ncbi:xanthine dehydrogenase accessory protein XdhC [Roseibium sp.]|uniref:xanthine dehydrogenase accessory protein XdhC n=1 Tax=Roseibium sp. TaxID=1936156 RepID=UPI003263FFD9